MSGNSLMSTARPNSAACILLGRNAHFTSRGCDCWVAAIPPRMVSDETWWWCAEGNVRRLSRDGHSFPNHTNDGDFAYKTKCVCVCAFWSCVPARIRGMWLALNGSPVWENVRPLASPRSESMSCTQRPCPEVWNMQSIRWQFLEPEWVIPLVSFPLHGAPDLPGWPLAYTPEGVWMSCPGWWNPIPDVTGQITLPPRCYILQRGDQFSRQPCMKCGRESLKIDRLLLF